MNVGGQSVRDDIQLDCVLKIKNADDCQIKIECVSLSTAVKRRHSEYSIIIIQLSFLINKHLSKIIPI